MIRPITPEDSATIIALAVAAGLFGENETDALGKVLADYFAGNGDPADSWIIDDEDGETCGVAYSTPAPMTDGTWYVKMIAVQPDRQGSGRGMAIMQHIELALRASRQRVLLVETSGLPEFERTRSFYVKCGFNEEARVRDFYKAGDDMVVFRKSLNGNSV